MPWSRSPEWLEDYTRQVTERWGEGTFVPQVAPSRAADEAFRRWWLRFERAASAPGNALAYVRVNTQVDVRPVLSTISVPTLILQRAEDTYRDRRNGRYLAQHIPGARYVELPGIDHLPYVGDSEAIVDEIQDFLTGVRPGPEPDRLLATVLITDIVGSTELAAELGDRRWGKVLEEHRRIVRRTLARFRGHEGDTAGDGFLATFDGPARAVRCAEAIVDQVRDLGLEVRAGLHTGEVELLRDGVGGIGVHIGARVSALAGPGEVLVSSTVKDLVAGSGLAFEERGEHPLKGVPGEWRLFSVAP